MTERKLVGDVCLDAARGALGDSEIDFVWESCDGERESKNAEDEDVQDKERRVHAARDLQQGSISD